MVDIDKVRVEVQMFICTALNRGICRLVRWGTRRIRHFCYCDVSIVYFLRA